MSGNLTVIHECSSQGVFHCSTWWLTHAMTLHMIIWSESFRNSWDVSDIFDIRNYASMNEIGKGLWEPCTQRSSPLKIQDMISKMMWNLQICTEFNFPSLKKEFYIITTKYPHVVMLFCKRYHHSCISLQSSSRWDKNKHSALRPHHPGWTPTYSFYSR